MAVDGGFDLHGHAVELSLNLSEAGHALLGAFTLQRNEKEEAKVLAL